MRARVFDGLWRSGHLGARMARGFLAPFGWAFAFIVRIRNLAYDREWLVSHALALPAISVGNLTVGGTGKTPVSAWIAAQLRERGARPGIVMRGYGDDEPLVHARLNPGVPVIVDADRVRGTVRARDAGATVVVLDDAFQHRRARRDADIVLLSADRFGPLQLLPAGPWREPLSSLARATLLVVTRKSASRIRALELLSHARRFAPKAEGAIVHLAADVLTECEGTVSRPATAITDARVLAISAIGEPHAFESQLRDLGARVDSAALPDHHRFTRRDGEVLGARANGVEWVVCTLKDAVKLSPIWPREAPPLWYLSQRVSVELGAESFDALFSHFAPRTAP